MAFIRMPNTKNSGIGATKDFLYSLHPAFAARFVYSFRRKRKIVITNNDFMSLTVSHKQLTERVLSRKPKKRVEFLKSALQLTFLDNVEDD